MYMNLQMQWAYSRVLYIVFHMVNITITTTSTDATDATATAIAHIPTLFLQHTGSRHI